MKNSQLSIIIISGNSQNTITDCLNSCRFASEIILVAANSTDNTKSIARKLIPHIKIVSTVDEYGRNFSKWRNLGLQAASREWILYVDTDERITPKLQQEINSIIHNDKVKFTHFAIPRENFYLDHRVKYGGTYPDYVKRLYLKSHLQKYIGILHEEPVVTGEIGYLKNAFQHYTHTDLHSMIEKTLIWTDMEARALYDNHHPPVVWWRFPRMMGTKFWQRLIAQQMWRDGVVGWISVIFETFDTFIIYARLWELQQQK